MATDARLIVPSSSATWTSDHSAQAGKPDSRKIPKSAMALWRPMVAILPSSGSDTAWARGGPLHRQGSRALHAPPSAWPPARGADRPVHAAVRLGGQEQKAERRVPENHQPGRRQGNTCVDAKRALVDHVKEPDAPCFNIGLDPDDCFINRTGAAGVFQAIAGQGQTLS